MLRLLLLGGFAAAMAWGAYDAWPRFPFHPPVGVLAPAEPVQQMTPERDLGEVSGYHLTAVADYTITARVLSTRRYGSERGGSLVPVDVAVGWGRMSDGAVLSRLRISQSFRFFFYEWEGAPPIPQREIEAHAANMHLIAGNSAVAHAVARLHAGEVVTFRGQLINARGPNGEIWNTSLSRTDTGPGACELFRVESLAREEALPVPPAPASLIEP